MPALNPNERRLMEELDEANETIRQLRNQVSPRAVSAYWLAGFSKSEAAILDCLADGKEHSTEVLNRCLDIANGREEGGSIKTLYVTMNRLRDRLAYAPGNYRVIIETLWDGRGYRIAPATLDFLPLAERRSRNKDDAV